MRKKICNVVCFSVLCVLITSCASMSRTGVVSPFANTEVQTNIRADIDFTEKVVGKSKQWYVAGFRVSGGNKFFENKSERKSLFGARANKAQASAMYNAMERGEYDVIANPQYKNEVHKWFFGFVKRYDVTVTGHGGKIQKLY